MNEKLEALKKSCIVVDIETSSKYPEGDLIDIRQNFEDYVKYAKVKWFGSYSYLHDEYVEIEVFGNEDTIKNYIAQHDVVIGFNSEEFDVPILYNNNLMDNDKRFMQVDCMIILGSATYLRHDGMPFKNRGGLMGYKFKNNSLKAMAEGMELETQKDEIDYIIFLKTSWTPKETEEIKKYLKADVKATKEMFEKLWDFWYVFTDFLSEKNVMNLSWIKSSISSLRYKGDCHTLGVEETYAEQTHEAKEEMGGRVIDPKYEEARGVWYVDYGSLYPWIRNMFGIDNEKEDGESVLIKNVWHGNDMFKVKGYYDISKQSPIAEKSIKHLTLRQELKKTDPSNPLIYAIKIYENAGYGALRSEIFEQIHTPNAGWDICWLGQQIQEYTEKRMLEFGYETIAGDTDSVFVRQMGYTVPTAEEVKALLTIIIKEILENVPFPNKGFNIDLEYPDALPYIMWSFAEQPVVGEDGKNMKNEKGRLIKEWKGKKKNYLYMYKDGEETKIAIKGFPIIKDNATSLGKAILEETIKPLIMDGKRAKFDKELIDDILQIWLEKPEAMKLLAREFKVKPDLTYKPSKDGSPSNVIQAQISRGYFNGQGGVVNLIKNNKIGRAGKSAKYCSYEEAVDNKIEMKDLDLTKVTNELSPFVMR